jgi:hypothetical protein
MKASSTNRRATGAALLLCGLCGCPNPNAYTTPRTLDPGKVQWQIAPEFIGVNYTTTTTTTNPSNGATQTQKSSESATLPMVPTFGARIGVVDGFDLGLRVANLDSLGIDGKIRLLTGTFDVALDPGLQGYYVTINNVSLGVMYIHLPVLLGLNVSEHVSLVLSPGVVYSVASASVSNASGVSGASSASGIMGRLGFGVDFRISPKFAIHPEITAMRQFGDSDALIYVGGVGFNIGAQPNYSDLASGGAPPASPSPPAQP